MHILYSSLTSCYFFQKYFPQYILEAATKRTIRIISLIDKELRTVSFVSDNLHIKQWSRYHLTKHYNMNMYPTL